MPKLRAIGDNILCVDANFGEQQTQSGIIIQKTIGKDEGIHPRWFKVHAVGPEIDWCKQDDWVYVEYGRWTEAMDMQDDAFDTEGNIKKVWKVDPVACMLIADEPPEGAVLGQFESFRGGLD
jgi:hypothetical protein